MVDTNEGRVLPRALTAVRAMSRMLAGAQPDRLPAPAEDCAADEIIVDCGLYLDGVRQERRMHYADALRAAGDHPNGFVWLGLKEPTPAQFAGIAGTFGLHELAVEDATVRAAQRPKVEQYGGMTFMALRSARYVEHEELTEYSEVVETGDVMIFLGEHFVITVRHGEACQLSTIRTQIDERSDLLKHGPWSVAHAVYDLVVDGFLDVLASIEDDIARVEERVFARTGHGRIQRIYQLKRELMEFKRAVLPLQRPVAGLVTGQLADVPKEIRKYFRDVNDHLTRAVEQVVYFDDLLNSVLQARLAQVTVDQNNDMRKIAAWAGIAAVPTAAAGVYGMNFRYLPELDWRYGYPGWWAIMLLICGLLYWGFRRSGWL